MPLRQRRPVPSGPPQQRNVLEVLPPCIVPGRTLAGPPNVGPSVTFLMTRSDCMWRPANRGVSRRIGMVVRMIPQDEKPAGDPGRFFSLNGRGAIRAELKGFRASCSSWPELNPALPLYL